MNHEHRRIVDEAARELDLLVYRLEQAPPADADALTAERRRLRRDLEKLRDRLGDLADGLF